MTFCAVDFHDEANRCRLMALIDLADSGRLACSYLTLCLDRSMAEAELSGFLRDLGWVGFEHCTLAPWTGGLAVTSDGWILLRMEV